MQLIYLNGVYESYDRAHVHVEDRGFLLGDGIYEVIRFYTGRPFLQAEHLDRLERSAAAIRLPLPERLAFERAIETLLTCNSLTDKDGTIYIQVTRGVAIPRTHGFPSGDVKPTVLIIARESPRLAAGLRENGIAVISVPDQRWGRCDIKAIGLLANVMAKQAAYDAGAFEAVLVRDGHVIEGSSTNLFGVKDGVIRTAPSGPHILSGCTRNHVLGLARKAGYQVQEESLGQEEIGDCSELFLTGTTTEVLSIVSLDGRPVGDGKPGPVAKALYAALEADML